MGPASTKSAACGGILLSAALFACRRTPSLETDAAIAAAPDPVVAGMDASLGGSGVGSATTTPAERERLDAGGDLLELAVPGYEDAFVSAPNGSVGARPVVVAPHGVGDRPDWQCNEWRRLVGPTAWVVCPRGIVSERWTTRGDTRWTWHGPPYMKKEIEAAVVALYERFGERVDVTGMVYGGFSYGAANGVAIVAKEASRFPYVVLTEGGADRWTVDLAKDFVKHGGKRVLFVCGQASCVVEAERAAGMIRPSGVETRVEYGEGEGHGYGGAVAARIRGAWTWVTAGDARWALEGERER